MQDITLENKKPEILRAIEYAKTKGVTAIKVELEAQLHRFGEGRSYDCDECDQGTNTCYECDGRGSWSCEECIDGQYEVDGEMVDCENGCDEGMFHCDYCDDGRITCSDCDGNWEADSTSYHDTAALIYILDQLGITEPQIMSSNKYYHQPDKCEWLQFAKFYNDGSVDSEMTFTVRLDNPENVFKVLDVMTAFNNLAAEIGNGVDVQGAGMHMAWLFTPDYSYPANSTDYLYEDNTRLRNFRRAINQMMPALFFLAAPANGQNWTRGFNYREPKVGFYPEKYSAIYFASGAMEFRVFDTCYENPEQVLDNAVVMSNCLKYWSTRYVGPETTTSIYGFGNDADRTLERLYYAENTLDLLYLHVAKLKPKYYTMNMLRKQRGFKINKGTIKRHRDTIKRNAQLAWKEFEDRWNIVHSMNCEVNRFQIMREYVQEAPLDQLRGLSDEQIEAIVNEKIEAAQERLVRSKPSMESYVRDYENNQLSVLQPRYHVSLS